LPPFSRVLHRIRDADCTKRRKPQTRRLQSSIRRRSAAVSSRSHTQPYIKHCSFLSSSNTAGNGLPLFIPSVNMHLSSYRSILFIRTTSQRSTACWLRLPRDTQPLAVTGTLSFGDIAGLEFVSTKRHVKDIRGNESIAPQILHLGARWK